MWSYLLIILKRKLKKISKNGKINQIHNFHKVFFSYLVTTPKIKQVVIKNLNFHKLLITIDII